jgi:hypothetical protein
MTAAVEAIDVGAFEGSGGLNIGVGAKHCLYTLRSDHFDRVATAEGPVRVRRSHHLRNLGKDWAEVASRLPDILAGMGLSPRVYAPGYVGGRLDPNAPPAPVVVPDTFPFGKYAGRTIESVRAGDLDYLIWVATRFEVSPRNAALYGFVAAVADAVADEVAARRAADAAAAAARVQLAGERAARYAPYLDALKASWAYGYWPKEIDALARGEEPGERLAWRWADAYAKGLGRANSRAYKAAHTEFLGAFAPAPTEET